MFENIDFGKGVRNKYIDFDVNKNIPLAKQVDLLKEDLLQVDYEHNYLIDVGWYPQFDERGSFTIYIIKDYQWDRPILQKRCRDLNALEEYMNECINVIQSKIK